MIRRTLFVLALAVAACDGDGDSETATDAAIGGIDAAPGSDAAGGSNDGEPASLAGMTQAHNDVRATVQTSPGLAPLSWDDSLAATAAAWIALCRDDDHNGLIDHNPDRGKGHSFSVGENIYASTGKANAEGAVDSWAGERADYDYGANACAATKQCGHYTQIVWRSTEKIGCAIGSCPNLTFSSTIVCDYGPAGNFVGQRPY